LIFIVVAVGVDEQVGMYVVVVDGDEDELRMDDGYGLAMLQISKVKMCGLNFGWVKWRVGIREMKSKVGKARP
jgi:hypothetical protein